MADTPQTTPYRAADHRGQPCTVCLHHDGWVLVEYGSYDFAWWPEGMMLSA